MWVISFIFVWDSKLTGQFLAFMPNMIETRNFLTSYFRLIEYNNVEEEKVRESQVMPIDSGRPLVLNSERSRSRSLKKKDRKYFPIDLKNRAFELKNIHFSYTEGYRVLENLNIEIQSKKRVALIGKQGSGKHTFLNLILKLYTRN